MATITLFEHLTLDGVMQAPGRPDEDTRGGFGHGGWGEVYASDDAMEVVGPEMAASDAMLFGRRTYEDLLHSWTTRDPESIFTKALVSGDKYVASRAGFEPAWPRTTVLAGEGAETVTALKEETDRRLTVLGSGMLARALHAAGLIDRYVLHLNPVVLGSGTRLFGDGDRTDLHLDRTVTTSSGVIVAVYERRPREH